MKRVTAALALIAPLAATGLLAPPAFADGTVHYDESVPCSYDFFGNEVCSTNVGQYHLTTTPSQMYIYTQKGSTSFTITTPDGTRYGQSYTYKDRYVTDQEANENIVTRQKSSQTFSINNYSCTFTSNFHYANGEIQFDRPTTSCT